MPLVVPVTVMMVTTTIGVVMLLSGALALSGALGIAMVRNNKVRQVVCVGNLANSCVPWPFKE